jgi:hypothetical protein
MVGIAGASSDVGCLAQAQIGRVCVACRAAPVAMVRGVR